MIKLDMDLARYSGIVISTLQLPIHYDLMQTPAVNQKAPVIISGVGPDCQ